MIYCADVNAWNKSDLGLLVHYIAHYNLITNDPQYVVFLLYCIRFTAATKKERPSSRHDM